MLAAIASAALLVAASLIVGRAVLALCARDDATGAAGPVGLALLLTAAGIAAGLGARGTALAITLAGLTLASLTTLLWVDRGRGAPAPAQRGARIAATRVAAALLAALFASIPFIAAGNVGILGVGLVNDDMASHLLLADWVAERFRPEPVLIDQGYPLGPHALVAGLGALLGSGPIEVFAGLTIAIPALTALVACAALERLGIGAAWRVPAAALVALPYLAAAYLAQEAFKEPLIALFLLSFALLLPALRGPRQAVALGVLAAGAVYVYSFPGLVWLAGLALAWLGLGLVRGGAAPARAALPAVLAALGALALLLVPELDRLRDFADFRALDPDRANEGGLGNLPGQLSPLEALGIWPTSDFRVSASASSVPAVVFYAGGLFAALALALGLPRWLRRAGPAVPAALATAVVVYLLALALGTVYTSAKALAIAAPLIALLTLGGLLTHATARSVSPDREPRTLGATGVGDLWRRLRSRDARTPADREVKPPATGADRPRRRALGLIAATFALAAAFSSFLVLRQAPVGPEAHAAELDRIRPLVEGEKLLFLGRDNFILYELRGSKPFTHVRNFYDPYFVEPNFELERVGTKFDFDSVTARTLGRFPYVLTTGAAYASGPSPVHEPVLRTPSYVLWERTGPVGDRRPGETGPEPGRTGGCEGATAVATFARPPVTAAAEAWSATTIEDGEAARAELALPPGRWRLSLRYDASRPLTLSAAGTETTLPGNLDFRGAAPFWPAGAITVRGRAPTVVTAAVERPPAAGRLLGADSVAHLGPLAATAVGADGGSGCAGYVDWYEPRARGGSEPG